MCMQFYRAGGYTYVAEQNKNNLKYRAGNMVEQMR